MFGMFGFGAGYFGYGPNSSGTPVEPTIEPSEIININGTFRRGVSAEAGFRQTVSIEVNFSTQIDLEVER